MYRFILWCLWCSTKVNMQLLGSNTLEQKPWEASKCKYNGIAYPAGGRGGRRCCNTYTLRSSDSISKWLKMAHVCFFLSVMLPRVSPIRCHPVMCFYFIFKLPRAEQTFLMVPVVFVPCWCAVAVRLGQDSDSLSSMKESSNAVFNREQHFRSPEWQAWTSLSTF